MMTQGLGRLLQDQRVRFVIAGVGAAMFFYLLNFVILSLGADPFWGTLTAYAVTVVVSYTIQQAWTFGGQHSHGEAFPRYVTAQILCAGTTGAAAHLVALYGLSAALISLTTTLLGGVMSYCLSRLWVFRDRPG